MDSTLHPSARRLIPMGMLALAAWNPVPAQSTQGLWTTSPVRQPTPRSEAPAAVVKGLIYVPGGFGPGGCCRTSTTFEVYDPAADKWSARKAMPKAVDHHMMVAYDDKLYVFWRESLWIYDPAGDSWSAAMPGVGVGLYAGGAVVLDGFVYVGGGATVFKRYDLRTGTWETLPSIRQYRDHLAMVEFEGKIWVMGGRSQGELNAFKTVDIYDPKTRQWTAGPDMKEIRSGFAAQVIGGRIYAVGGEVGRNDVGKVPSATIGTAERFDPTKGAWEYVAPPPNPIHGVANAVYGGKLYLLGGSDKAHDAVVTGKVFVYDPQTPSALIPPGAGMNRKAATPSFWFTSPHFASPWRDAEGDGYRIFDLRGKAGQELRGRVK